MVAKTIGTHVSLAWETESGVRPVSGYRKWCDARSHPDFNPERDQVETTTLCQTNNHTYEDGLMDFGTLEFGSNMTQETFDMFLADGGYVSQYAEKAEQGLGLWICVHVQGINKAYYVPVKPQPFGLPEGEAGSNAYELIVRFSVTGDAGWHEAPMYVEDTAYTFTVSGYTDGATINVIGNNGVVRSVKTVDTTTTIQLPEGKYVVMARAEGQSTLVEDLVLTSNGQSVTF